jgi:hypothetical protein
MRRVQNVLALLVLCVLAAGCANETSENTLPNDVLDAQVVAHDDQAANPNTPILNANGRVFVCVDSHVQGNQETICDKVAEVSQSADVALEKYIRYTADGKVYQAVIVEATSEAAKTIVSRLESKLTERDLAVNFPFATCVTKTQAVGHFVFDPSGTKHCCPTSTFVASIDQGDLNLAAGDDGFSSHCCKTHEIWDGLGHCWDGNILPPSWTPPWLGDPMTPKP